MLSKKKMINFKESFTRFTFLLPTIFFFGFTLIIPFFTGFRVAFTNWNGISPLNDADFVGLGNFVKILHNSDVLRPLRISLQYAIMNTLGCNLLGLFLALGVTKKYPFNNIHRLIFFMPAALSNVLAVFMWNYIFSGVLPAILGINNLLSGISTVIPAVTIITVWAGSGVCMLIYIAGLSSVPNVLYESALIDGASGFQKLVNITIPMIMPSFTINVTITFTNSLASTGLFLAATQGGPAGASESMGLYIYNFLFKYNKAGYGQALAYLFLIAIVIVGIFISRIFRNREVEL